MIAVATKDSRSDFRPPPHAAPPRNLVEARPGIPLMSSICPERFYVSQDIGFFLELTWDQLGNISRVMSRNLREFRATPFDGGLIAPGDSWIRAIQASITHESGGLIQW